jgi:predicted phosphodiesterase
MTEVQRNIHNWLIINTGYLKKSAKWLHENVYYRHSLKDVEIALNKARNNKLSKYLPSTQNNKKVAPAAQKVAKKAINQYDVRNTLIIGDTHEPFCKEGYLEHCLDVQKQYNCGTVVHIGDLVDNHAVSYHEHDPDGKSPGDEFKLALQNCEKWYKAFPNVKICIGNHDKLPFRKAFTAGLPANWLKSYQEMFNSPKTWEWDFIHKVNGVIYQHGTGMSGEMASINAARENRQSTVIGHLHTVSNIRFLASEKDLIFGMNVGCGIDHSKYAFAYGREAPRKPVLSCGVVIDGRSPINIPMNLKK